MRTIYPKKLKANSMLRVIALARSLAIIDDATRQYADAYFTDKLHIKRSFGKNVTHVEQFNSPSISDRINDMHIAFSDSKVDGLITVIGGYNSNQLLDNLDWENIKKHPKVLCGFSDITALQNAIYAKTGVVTYSGPHYINFGQKIFDEYTADYFKKCLFSDEPYEILSSTQWTDDQWFLNQNKRTPIKNEGFWSMQEGVAEGTIIGGNLCTLNLLQGTEYMPIPDRVLLFIEDDEETYAEVFDRDLQSLLHCLGENRIQGVVIGRFQRASEMNKATLEKILITKRQLKGVPIIANADFGHTDPKITFPIGGQASLSVDGQKIKLIVTRH